ncbi:endoplasmic reticulum vesicle protein 25, partial [Tilletiaria anomala UBC 951]
LVALSLCLQCVSAIKFEVPASHEPYEKCVWNYALANTLVVITVNISPMGSNSDKQAMDVQIVDGSKHKNVYLNKKKVEGETRMAINTHSNADLGVCFKNHLSKSVSSRGTHSYHAVVDLDVDIGADAVDYNAIANQESLSGLETELRKLEAVADEVLNEMDYLKKREARMRDTNESTNERVAKFGWLTIVGLLALGIWQIVHLRGFFKRKYLID